MLMMGGVVNEVSEEGGNGISQVRGSAVLGSCMIN